MHIQFSLVRHRGAVMFVLAVVVGFAWVGTGSAATKTGSPPRFPFCSWWFETTPQTVNVALPDTSAAYWTTPFLATPGLKISVKGRFPDARFMSVTVYDNSAGTFSRNGVSSGLSDYQIKPDPGTRNPFQQSTRREGRFSLTIQRHVSPSQTNVLPLVPAKPAKGLFPPGNGFIIYRVYLPHSGSFDSVSLPKLVFSRNSETEPLPQCSGNNHQVQPLARTLLSRIRRNASAAPKFPPPYDPLAFSRPLAATTNSLFPNDASAYLFATFFPTAGTVVVVQGKAPTFTPDSSALPWPDPAYDLRYWSLCNNVNASPYPVVDVTDPQTGNQIFGCSADLNTPLVDGQYTYVLSSPADRPPNTTAADGVAWLPYSENPTPDTTDVLVLRNMLGDGFSASAQQVPEDENPASAQQVMGDYYPRMAQCPVSTYTQGGASACLAAGG